MNTDEEVAWLRLWATPQAVAWESLGWTPIVARYCRLMVESDGEQAAVTLLAETRHLEDRLGLNPMAMRRLMWQIAPDEVGERRQERGSSARERMRAV